MSVPPYLRPLRSATAELKERGSRFIGLVHPVSSEAETLEVVDSLRRRYHDSTHVCWAARLGPGKWQRAVDDGEPRGTAGQPILAVLEGERLGDVVAAVVRYFGGTKLGKGGLVRAYSDAARRAVEELISSEPPGVEQVVARERWRLETDYSTWSALEGLLSRADVLAVETTYGESVRAILSVPVERAAQVRADLDRFQVRVVVLELLEISMTAE